MHRIIKRNILETLNNSGGLLVGDIETRLQFPFQDILPAVEWLCNNDCISRTAGKLTITDVGRWLLKLMANDT